MKDYYLHSRIGETFHFREVDGVGMFESFSLTYIPNGTVVFSGDYDALTWNRKAHSLDYGFPDKGTDVRYFAQKVRMSSFYQKIEEWDYEQAIKDVKEAFEWWDSNEEETEKFNEMLEDENWEYSGEYGMMEDLQEFDTDCWESRHGIRFTHGFLQTFEKAISVSQLVLDEVKIKN